MFNKDVVIKPFIFLDEINEIVEERGNQYTAIRKVQWIKEGEDPDPTKGKLEIRKWMIQKDGSEQANKGVVFMTENGPNQLTEILVKNNYGDTKNIIKSLLKRENFKESLQNLDNDDTSDNSGDYFDMRDMLLSYEETENKDDDSDE